MRKIFLKKSEFGSHGFVRTFALHEIRKKTKNKKYCIFMIFENSADK